MSEERKIRDWEFWVIGVSAVYAVSFCALFALSFWSWDDNDRGMSDEAMDQIGAWTGIGLAVAFGAFCIWLGVRVLNRREPWAIRTGLLIGLFVGMKIADALFFWVMQAVFGT